jgi:Lhr-like helicase
MPPPPQADPRQSWRRWPFACFHPVTAEWFRAVFDAPTAPQRMGWPVIARGESALILAPTGTGKTLTAFLWCLDRLMLSCRHGVIPRRGILAPTKKGCRIVYISPLKALAVDVERNLRSPLAGMANMARRMGVEFPRADHQRAHRRHAAARARPLCAPSRRDPDHHAGVALPAAHVAGIGSAAHRGYGDRR